MTSRTDNACPVCGLTTYPHAHSDTAQALMEVTGTVKVRLLPTDTRDAALMALLATEEQAECECRRAIVNGETVILHWHKCFMRVVQVAIRMIEASG